MLCASCLDALEKFVGIRATRIDEPENRLEHSACLLHGQANRALFSRDTYMRDDNLAFARANEVACTESLRIFRRQSTRLDHPPQTRELSAQASAYFSGAKFL